MQQANYFGQKRGPYMALKETFFRTAADIFSLIFSDTGYKDGILLTLEAYCINVFPNQNFYIRNTGYSHPKKGSRAIFFDLQILSCQKGTKKWQGGGKTA